MPSSLNTDWVQPMPEPMPIVRESIPKIARLYRFQWEAAQDAYVLLFPEGMVHLNATAGEILRRCNGVDSVAQIIADLETAFETQGIAGDVEAFLLAATQSGWIEWRETVES
jgi:pyrroloquinoline quinone biosynthesis protein D